MAIEVSQLIPIAPQKERLSPEAYYALAIEHWYRASKVDKMRLDTPTKVATPAWAVRELLYYATEQNQGLADAVLVVTLRGGLCGLVDLTVSTPLPGRRIVKLLYMWDDLEPHLHLKPVKVRDDVIAKMGLPGAVLRARVRHVREGGTA